MTKLHDYDDDYDDNDAHDDDDDDDDWEMVYSDKIKQCLQSSQKLFTGSCLREVSNYEFW